MLDQAVNVNVKKCEKSPSQEFLAPSLSISFGLFIHLFFADVMMTS
jgi:hypothetical protein